MSGATPDIRVAVVHYHLRRGGVSRVIANHHAFLGADGRAAMAVFCGEEPADTPGGLKWMVLEELAYGGDTPDADALLEKIRSGTRKLLGGEPDLIHVHNHSLGKNLSVPKLVGAAARKRVPLMLHIHDLAEDGRPANYAVLMDGLGGEAQAAPLMYPQAPWIHYGVLTQRDRRLLTEAGASARRVHVLPNPVAVPAGAAGRGGAGGRLPEDLRAALVLLYPVRGIRRKNLGEFLLHAAALAGGGDVLMLQTLPPQTEEALVHFRRWRRLAAELELPCRLEVGTRDDVTLELLYSAADACITTSITEGFGLAFLEPHLFDTPIVGRNLPLVTADFVEEGMSLSHLYDELTVPADWIDTGELERRVDLASSRAFEAYRRARPRDFVERTVDSMIRGDGIEFGRLDEDLQESIVRRVASDPALAAHLKPSPRAVLQPPSNETTALNRRVVEERYSLERTGGVLMQAWKSLLEEAASADGGGDGDAVEAVPPSRLVELLLRPQTFNLLRT